MYILHADSHVVIKWASCTAAQLFRASACPRSWSSGRERQAPLAQRLPQNSADTKIGLPERFQNVIGILNELGKANGEVTVATEIRTMISIPTARLRVWI